MGVLSRHSAVIVLAMLFCLFGGVGVVAAGVLTPDPPPEWWEQIDSEFGGHVKMRGSVAWPGDRSVFRLQDLSPAYDGFSEARLKNETFITDTIQTSVHYELAVAGGDTRSRTKKLERSFPAVFSGDSLNSVNDRRRFMDLTWNIYKNDDLRVYHRLDRLSVSLVVDGGKLTIGRQAVTWGNGMLFNPMDLFNPFAPTEIDRDYKLGDDMVHLQFPIRSLGNMEVLYVPRRDLVNREVRWDESSLAFKDHFSWDDTEFDVMFAKHYADYVAGLGLVGYLGDAAWRVDATWTFLDESTRNMDGYASVTANMDYSWVWWKTNFYGYIEFFYNGLSNNDYSAMLVDPAVSARVSRGEMFTLGKYYLSAHVDVELHPLVRFYFTTISNIVDPSGMLQPRVVWSVAQDLDMTLGGNLSWGPFDSEYGGYRYPQSDLYQQSADTLYCWWNYYY